ncbi:c-type cytochrome [Polyangium sp. y55x31]|uniref:c-type cytochrome n=1 Tax=Polyangium sp. y55x31 TaxID=3042688 RepID=UPI002482F95C|nr:c-type cytochrome [Polyangium sp. y55x31]MDI1483894.1 c-type cytochrome [Polyangium sp. y55x31]
MRTHLRRPLALLLVSLAGASIAAGCSGIDDTFVPNADIAVAAVSPPAISGGTLAIAGDGRTAVAADPDRDMVWIVDLEAGALKAKVALEEGDEPGRVAIDGQGRAHVALRSGGAVASIDVAGGKLIERRQVCATPRGIAYEAENDRLHVACQTGELVTLPAGGGAATRVLKLERDLRDVVVQGDKLLVSRFRSAEVLVVGIDGKIWQREAPAKVKGFDPFTGGESSFEPAVAWRMVSRPNGGALMVHQRGTANAVVIEQPGGYGSGGGCDGSIVQTTVTEVEPGDESVPIVIPPIGGASLSGSALPVDIAVSPNETEVTIVAAGNNAILRTTRTSIANSESTGCDPSFGEQVPGQPIAAQYWGNGDLAVQLREPAAIYLPNTQVTITLPGESRRDTGHDVFHKSANGFNSLACASCHPEAMDDARTWNFNPIGPRRTQSIRGGILATAPLHWDGDMEDLGHIMSEVFVNRMGGQPLGPRQSRLVGRWIDAQPVLPKAEIADTTAVERGKEVYFDAKVGCATCHNGAKLTNNDWADVGTGKAFQVPTLMGIADRAPFMHDGCAPTLRDRFNPACGGGDKHGVTSHLTPAQVDDLVAYLETL